MDHDEVLQLHKYPGGIYSLHFFSVIDWNEFEKSENNFVISVRMYENIS